MTRLTKYVMITLLLSFVLFLPTVGQAQYVIEQPFTYSSNFPNVTGFSVVTTAGTSAATAITTGATNLYGLTVSSGAATSGTTVWVNIFNTAAASVNPGTTTAVFSIPLVGVNQETATPMPWGSPIPFPFSTAMSFNCTTTRNGATGVGVACTATGIKK